MKKDYNKDINLIFEQNKRLSKIGTKEQYSKYLKTIFPESESDEIVYHGGGNIEGKFKTKKGGYFSKDKEYAKEFLAINQNATKMNYALLDIKNPTEINYVNSEIVDILNKIKRGRKIDKNKLGDVTPGDKRIKLLLEELEGDNELQKQIRESDAFIGKDLYDDEHTPNIFSYGGSPEYFYHLKHLAENTENIIVFNPSQIHILGSKKDAKKFYKFVHGNEKKSLERIISGIFLFSFFVGLFLSSGNLTGNVVGSSGTESKLLGIGLILIGVGGFFVYKKLKLKVFNK
jgi:hypothetical protein